MTTPPGADIRGYYTALGIELPAWATLQASVRCFADPGAHQHQDRNPSCSVNLDNGAFNCHGCGARGGAYDAALATGHTPRSAIDLMIAHHLTEPRTPDRSPQPTPRRPYTPPRPTPPALSGRRRRIITDIDIADWQQRLASQPHPLPQLRAEQQAIWRDATIRELELGLDQGRITIPIRDRIGTLQGVLRYAPRRTRSPKMLAIAATWLGLIPHPATERSRWIVLVEGPPDMIAARSRAIPAIAVPGDHAWDPAWAPLLAGRHVAIITDADPPGRDAAQRIASDLTPHAATIRTIDPAPDRDDGYDLTDWLHAHPTATGSDALRDLGQTSLVRPHRASGRRTRPTDRTTPVTQPPAQPRAPTTPAAAIEIPIGSHPLSHSHCGLLP